ncbi:hypothetical protein BDF14DRAFT_1835590 [Spinellus fusiger]|nr:hypothetical protein BDF14DRAFT_1835590 [Spinellus fusiger]
MLVGPHHGMYTMDPDRNNHGLEDPSYLPRGSVPPGARFDPIAPFGSPSGRGRGMGMGRGGNRFNPRGPSHAFSGEPDNDELMPPGYDSMFM